MKLKNYILLILIIIGLATQAQELNCKVSVISPNNQSVDPRVFKNMEIAIQEFLNGRKWTNDSYKPYEKIKCSITLNITEIPTEGTYKADAIVQSQRPVFNSMYNTVLLSYKDNDFDFDYADLQILDYNNNAYSSHLTSLLAYYAYMIIGYDNESFSENGGEDDFQQALTIINNIPSQVQSQYKGWNKLDGTRNRFALVDGWLNPRYKMMRKAFLFYHFNGLDNMYTDASKSRTVITTALTFLQQVNKDNPNLMPLRVFFEGKKEELLNIYSKADIAEKNSVVQLLSTLDPVNAASYKKIGK
ncbi:MAG: DUF4835 family protein [Chitinophagales bacterium]|nr:DUF4835 family protein [Chitinophagales bacterium]